jgi:PadR family transcriptional regulator PadR
LAGTVVKRTNPNFLNGVPELVVLRLLSRREMYGYEIVRAIQARTKDAFTFGEGCIYPLLHYLEQTRSVTSRRMEVEGRSRQYYRLTPRGIRRLEELSREWNEVAAGVSLFMEQQNA